MLILPFISVKPDERVEQALLRFAQTVDREFAVENGEGRLIGTLALLDLVLAEETAAEPSERPTTPMKLNTRAKPMYT